MLVRSKGDGEPNQTGAEVDDPNFPHARSADGNIEGVASTSWYTIKIPEEIRVVIENDLSEGNMPTAISPSAPLNLNSNPPTPPSRYLRPAS